MPDLTPFRNPDTPLGSLDTSKYTYSNYIYPMDLGSETDGPTNGKDHYIVFHINESSNTQFATQTVNGQAPGMKKDANGNLVADQNNQPTINANTNKDKGLNPDGSLITPPNADGTTAQGADGNTATQSVIGNSSRPIQRVATTIVLYMPPEIQTSYAASWAEANIGVAKEAVDLFKKNGGGSLKDLFQSGGASFAKHLGELGNNFTDLDLTDAISLANRMVINNHQEVIFNGITFRQFNFNFRFTPESKEEAINVDNIIRAFKFYSAPEILQGWAGRFWIYPAEFDIEYWSNGKQNAFLNKISTCALTNMTVNYTPIGHWAAFREHDILPGAPSVCTDITLQFTELELITKKRILEGY